MRKLTRKDGLLLLISQLPSITFSLMPLINYYDSNIFSGLCIIANIISIVFLFISLCWYDNFLFLFFILVLITLSVLVYCINYWITVPIIHEILLNFCFSNVGFLLFFIVIVIIIKTGIYQFFE